MANAHTSNDIPEPDISHLVTEDDEPVDSIFSERQHRLLIDPLYASWRDEQGNVPRFIALANVGLFFALHEPPVVPDVMLSLDVDCPTNIHEKKHRSYLVWEFGKPPDVVIEAVSNREGGEEAKLEKYARIGVPYAVIFDPDHHIGQRALRVYAHHARGYVDLLDPSFLPEIGLGLTLWTGSYEGFEWTWLRWCDRDGRVLQTGGEAAAAAQERLDRLEARLRELGVDP